MEEKYIKLLNSAFEKEYNDVFLYLREAELFKKKIVLGEKIERIFSDFSAMELRHADRVASKLIELGAKPKWVFRPLEGSNSLREVLERHVVSEMAAIHIYNDIISICTDYDFKIILKGIRENEEEHLAKVSRFLKKLKA